MKGDEPLKPDINCVQKTWIILFVVSSFLYGFPPFDKVVGFDYEVRDERDVHRIFSAGADWKCASLDTAGPGALLRAQARAPGGCGSV